MAEKTETKTTADQEERRTWERPQVKRIVAGEAEASGSPSSDIVYS